MHIFNLLNDNGLIDLQPLESFYFSGLMMDLQSINFFGTHLVAIGINSFVMLMELDTSKSGDKMLVRRQKIINQIAVFKLKLSIIDHGAN